MRILIVEDEIKLSELIEARLKKEKYIVDIANDGEEGSFKALTGIYDLILLDVMLPKKDGFEILKEIKNSNINSIIMMITARTSLNDKLEGFEYGADDYLTKPFHIEELVARVNSKLRKNNKDKNILEYEDIKLDMNKTLLMCTNSEDSVEVSNKELMVLECLLNNSKQVVSKDFLFDNVWGIESDSMLNNLEAYLSFIRKKLKTIGSNVEIKSVRGIGYKLEVNNEKVKE